MSDVVPYLGRLRSKRFHASSSRKLVRQQKRKGITEEGEKSFFSPLPFPLPFFFFLLPLQRSRNNSIGNACYAGYKLFRSSNECVNTVQSTFQVVLCLLYTYWDIRHFVSLFISNLSKMLKFAATHREMTTKSKCPLLKW